MNKQDDKVVLKNLTQLANNFTHSQQHHFFVQMDVNYHVLCEGILMEHESVRVGALECVFARVRVWACGYDFNW